MSYAYLPTATRASLKSAYYAAAGSGGGGGSTSTISTFATASVSSLTVSTINGAPYVPGGGSIPANLTVSTLAAYPNGSATPQNYVLVGGTPNNVVSIRNQSTLVSYIDLDLRDAAGVNTDLARTNLGHNGGITTVYSQNAGANFKGSIAILSSINNSLGGVKLTGQDGSYLQVGSNQIEAFSQDGTTLLVGPGTVQVSDFTTPAVRPAGFLNVYSPTLIQPILSTNGAVGIFNGATAASPDITFTTNNNGITGNPGNGIQLATPNNSNIASVIMDNANTLYLIAPVIETVSQNPILLCSTTFGVADATVYAGQILLNGNQVPALRTPLTTPYLIQSGYAQDVTPGNPILFPVPYANDKVLVMLTPTNRNTTGGGNPQCSLLNTYGNDGTGVSSIGFATDTRNGGVGYAGSFFWQSMPLGS